MRTVTFTHDHARALLSLDDISRRRCRWRLVENEELLDLIIFFMDHEAQRAVIEFDRDILHCSPGGPHFQPDLNVIKSCSEFFKRLATKAPLLAQIFDVADGHVVVAGGSVVGVLNAQKEVQRDAFHERWFGPRRSAHDVDLFFYGIDRESDATALLQRIFEKVFDPLPKQRVHMSRTPFAVSVTVHTSEKVRCTYQFILRLYESVDNILGGFDLACCSVGFSPSTGLIATKLGAWSIALSIVIVDCSRRSETFEVRLQKYNNRGFTVVFPSIEALDGEKFRFNEGKLRVFRRTEQRSYGGHEDIDEIRPASKAWVLGLKYDDICREQDSSDYSGQTNVARLAYANIVKVS